MPQFRDNYDEFEAEHGHGFSRRQLDLLKEYSRMKAMLDPETFEAWYMKKLKEVEDKGPDPQFEVLRAKLKPLTFE